MVMNSVLACEFGQVRSMFPVQQCLILLFKQAKNISFVTAKYRQKPGFNSNRVDPEICPGECLKVV